MRLLIISGLLCCSFFLTAQHHNSFIIQLEDDAVQIHSLLAKQFDVDASTIKIEEIFPSLDIYQVNFQQIELEKSLALSKLKNIDGILEAELNLPIDTRDTPNDALFDEQWDLSIIDMERAWNVSTGGTTVQNDDIVIAIIDDGFDIEHEDINENIWVNKAEIPGNQIDDDQNGFVDDILGANLRTENGNHDLKSHGTSVSGIIGAKGDNGIGVAGINWNSKLMLLSGITNSAEIIKGYNYAAAQRELYNATNGEQGAFVVATNLSSGIKLAFASEFPIWCGIYEALGKVGVLNASATVNDDFNIDEVGDMPSTCPSQYLIAVTNSDRFDEKVVTAGYGNINIDLSAPGDESYTIGTRDTYGEFWGTSAASPHVAGAIALMYGVPCDNFIAAAKTEPAMTALNVKEAILSSVDPLPSLEGITVTGGRLNVFGAMLVLTDFCQGTSGEMEIADISVSQLGRSINIQYETPDFNEYELGIYDVTGRKLFYDNFNPPIFGPKIKNVDISSFTNGVYFVVLKSDKNKLSASFSLVAQ